MRDRDRYGFSVSSNREEALLGSSECMIGKEGKGMSLILYDNDKEKIEQDELDSS